METNLGTQLDTRGELSLSDSRWLSYKRLLQLAFCFCFCSSSEQADWSSPSPTSSDWIFHHPDLEKPQRNRLFEGKLCAITCDSLGWIRPDNLPYTVPAVAIVFFFFISQLKSAMPSLSA